jgi:hypothetical protein
MYLFKKTPFSLFVNFLFYFGGDMFFFFSIRSCIAIQKQETKLFLNNCIKNKITMID